MLFRSKTMATALPLTMKPTSKFFSESTIESSIPELVRLPTLGLRDLVVELNSFVDKENLPVGVPALLATKYSVPDRMVRRYFSRVKNDYK